MAKPKIIQILTDIVYATMGIQNSEAHKTQFEQASLLTYVVAGLLGIAIFVGVIALLVTVLL